MRLKLVHLAKEFVTARGNIAAVKDIHLEIADGEFFVLLGPSGCGKSTILNLVAGLEKPSGGEIWFDDRMVASAGANLHLSPKERNVAMVFQSYALYPHLTVFGNIAFPLQVMKQSKRSIREAVHNAASMLGIADLLGARPGELSGGQRQRVAIARAIVRHPTLFLMDEPLSNLDAQLRSTTRVELKRLQRRLGVTTVYVTHDQIEAMSLGDRIALLRNGCLEQVGMPETLYEKPTNTFVATFIGSLPMNLIEVSVVAEHGIRVVFPGGIMLKLPRSKSDRSEETPAGKYTLGLRPENIHIQPVQESPALQGTVLSVEPLGREVLLRVQLDGQELSVLTGDKRWMGAQSGDLVGLRPDLEKAHLFPATTDQHTV